MWCGVVFQRCKVLKETFPLLPLGNELLMLKPRNEGNNRRKREPKAVNQLDPTRVSHSRCTSLLPTAAPGAAQVCLCTPGSATPKPLGWQSGAPSSWVRPQSQGAGGLPPARAGLRAGIDPLSFGIDPHSKPGSFRVQLGWSLAVTHCLDLTVKCGFGVVKENT